MRDREGLLPLEELDAYSQSGLWGINIPKAYGGPEVSYTTLAKVISIIAAADPSIAQITQNHLAINGHIDLDGTPEQKKLFFGWSLSGLRFGNAFSELNSKTVAAFETTIVYDGEDAVINGEKFYTTGALLAHFIPIVAVDPEGKAFLSFAERETPGLTVTNNWSSFGQRTTASGQVKIENVRLPRSRLLAVVAFDRPTIAGPVSQIIQSAIDAGIARGAISDAIAFVRTQSRPWIDSGKEKASEDLFTIHAVGDLKIRLHAAEALLEEAGRAIDVGQHPSDRRQCRRRHNQDRRVQGSHDRDRHSCDQQAVRTRRHARDARQAQSRPALAQRARPHAARSRALEIFSRRQFLSERRATAASCLELRR